MITNEKYQKKCQKAERAFIGYVLWLYKKKSEWSKKDFEHLYNKFIIFSKKIHSEETSLLETGSKILKDENWNLLNKVLDYKYNESRELIYSILAIREMQVPVQIVLIGTITKLMIEDTNDLSEIINRKKENTNE